MISERRKIGLGFGFFGCHQNSVDNAIVARPACHFRHTKTSLNFRTLRDYAPSVVVNVCWVADDPEDFGFLGFARFGIGNGDEFVVEQFHFGVTTIASGGFPFGFTKGCFGWENSLFKLSFNAGHRFSAASALLLV